MPPDPKGSTKRIIDPKAILRAKVKWPNCAACGHYGGDGHHVLPKDRGGDDVEANIVVLCGSGSSRCHGAHHGSPYVVTIRPDPRSLTKFAPYDERRDAEWVNRKIGKHLERERPDVIGYILGKLGDWTGALFLEKTYYLEVK